MRLLILANKSALKKRSFKEIYKMTRKYLGLFMCQKKPDCRLSSWFRFWNHVCNFWLNWNFWNYWIISSGVGCKSDVTSGNSRGGKLEQMRILFNFLDFVSKRANKTTMRKSTQICFHFSINWYRDIETDRERTQILTHKIWVEIRSEQEKIIIQCMQKRAEIQ